MQIPKIIHQTWKSNDIPENLKEFVNSWRRIHPEYVFMLWSDDDNLELIKRKYPQFLELYLNIPTPVMRSDFARYVVLYHHGGFYIDLDVMCYKSLESLPIKENHELILTEEHPTHGIEFGLKQIVTNWFFGCIKHSNLMDSIIKIVQKNLQNSPTNTEPLHITGPFMMTKAYNELKNDNILLLKYDYLNPFPKQFLWNSGTIPPVPPQSIGLHYYDGSWWRKSSVTRIPESVEKEAVFTIITPTIGRRSLLKLKEILRKENTPYVHLILWDKKRCANALTPSEVEDERTFCYEMKHPPQNPKNSKNVRMDVWLRAVGISMARTKYIKCCDDDTWPEENHLEEVYKYLEDNQLDFTWCFRRMWKMTGELIGVDRFEATGEKTKFGYTLLDNSSLFYNKKAGNILQQVFQQKQIFGDDRYTSKPLHANCKGLRLEKVLTNHACQPHLEQFFIENCIKE